MRETILADFGERFAIEKPMKGRRAIFAPVGIALLLAAAASFGQEVKIDYDHGANFSRYKTFSWEKVVMANPAWADRIKAAIAADLAKEGWRPVESGGDISVIALDMDETHQSLNTYYDAFGGTWSWKGGWTDYTTTVDTYQVGTLVVDLFDANTKKLIWRGSSSKSLSNKSDKNFQNLDKGVQKMFEHFPPAPKDKDHS
jgi:hypothetical protein